MKKRHVPTLGMLLSDLAARCLAIVVLLPALSPAQTFTTLFQFNGAKGGTPVDSLIQGFNGNLYGTSEFAGSHGGTNFGGTAFDITTGGALTTLYNFCVGGSGNCTDGYNPTAALAQDASGNFFGTATSGGTHGPFQAYGTFFKLTSGGTLTTLYSFCAQGGCADGANPNGGVILASNGSLYGTTVSGGTKSSGSVFKVTTGGTLTTLYNFCSLVNCGDGSQPSAGLIQAKDGSFYGTTNAGGTNSMGTVFKITSSGTFKTLYHFCTLASCTDGAQPSAKLLQGADGNLYGTTSTGGNFNNGSVFKITTAGKLTTLYSFCKLVACADGKTPAGALIQATDGNFYGTTFLGGGHNQGTIFTLKPTGALTTLYSFCPQAGCPDGANPISALVQDTNGEFYGTAMDGGSTAFSCDGAGNGGTAAGCGTVFSLSVGLSPFLSLLSTSGKVGAKVGMLGQGFDSSSVVKFNGVMATTRTVTGTSYILATVPAGASSGLVTVTTGATTLTSTKTYMVHNSWGSGAAMPSPSRYPVGVGAINGKLYVVGGTTTGSAIINTNQVYNAATNSWTTAAPLPAALMGGTGAVVNSILYVIGGYDGTHVVNTVYAYNPSTNSWTSKATMPTARASIGSSVEKGVIYVVGGVNGDGHTRLNTVEAFNPATNTWTTEAPLLAGKSEVSVGLVGSTLIAADGYTTSADTGDNEGYTASTNTWKSLASDPTPRHDSCYGVIGSLMYIAGGGLSPISTNESYGVSANSWKALSPMPVATTAPGSAVWNGQLYCFGGGDSTGPTGGTFYNNVQIYQP